MPPETDEETLRKQPPHAPEGVNEFSYTLLIAAVGVLLFFSLDHFIKFKSMGMLDLLAWPVIPMILLLMTRIGKKTFFSLRTISLLFMTFIWSYAVAGLIAICVFLIGDYY